MPYPLKFTYPQSDTADKQAAALKETWDQAGFDETLDPLGDTYYDVVQQPDKDSDVMWAGWGSDWPSAITVTPPLFDSRPNLTANSDGQDYGAYKSDEFNALVDEAANAADVDAQTAALQKADEVLARITPLWQGVDLTRMLAVGHVDAGPALVHLIYLLALAAAGTYLAVRSLERRLQQ